MFKAKPIKYKDKYEELILRTAFAEFKYKIKRIVNTIKRVLAYAKQGYNTYDWDYGYLIKDICFKLDRMEKQFEKEEILYEEDYEQMIKGIKVTKKLLNRYQDGDFYFDVKEAILERKWGKSIHWTPAEYQKKELKDPNSRLQRWYFISAPYEVLKNDQYKEYQKDERRVYKRMERKQERDFRVALKIIQKYLSSWWS